MKTFIELQENFNSNKFIIKVCKVCCDHERLITSFNFKGTKEEVIEEITKNYLDIHNVHVIAYDVDFFDYEIDQMLQEYNQWFVENSIDDLPF